MRLQERPVASRAVAGEPDRRERHGVAAFVVFVALFCAAFAVLLSYGYGEDARNTLSYVWFYVVLAAAALIFPKPSGTGERPAQTTEAAVTSKSLSIVQLGVCAVVVVITGTLGAFFNPTLPGLAPLSFQSLFHYGAIQFALDVGLVFTLLRVLKVRAGAMGLGRWTKGSWIVALLCASMPVVYLGIAIATPQQTFVGILALLARNVFQNGFSEEFLFRGALLGRLRAFMPVQWAVLVQALVFGIWHVGTDSRIAGGKPLVTLALMIALQAAFGLTVGYITVRTRSIATGTIFHVLLDASRLA